MNISRNSQNQLQSELSPIFVLLNIFRFLDIKGIIKNQLQMLKCLLAKLKRKK